MANELTIYQSVIDDVKDIISSGMESAYNATSRAMVLTYWNVGKRIAEQEQLKQEIERQKAVFYMQHPLQIEEGGDKA